MSDTNAVEKETTSDFEIEVVENTGDASEELAELPKSPALKRDEPDLDEGDEADSEISQYSENVQKRIKQLTYEKHEERRQNEEARKLRDEAVRYAETISQENKRLQELATRGETAAVSEASSRVDTSIQATQKKYKDAFETGDTDALVEAQSELSRLEVEKSRLQAYAPAEQQPQQPPPHTPDPRALQWQTENPWFNTDPVMRGAAMGLHNDLAMNGYQPGSEVYYTELDKRLRDAFPQKFDQSDPSSADSQQDDKGRSRSPGNVVAPAGRSGKSSRKVQLTVSQVALAKRLGITPEQYAAQMLKDMNNDE